VSVYKFIGLYLLIILGIFVEPGFLGSLGNAFFKLLVLAGISYLLYEIWNAPSAIEESETNSIEPAPFTNVNSVPEKVFENIPMRLDSFLSGNEALKQFLSNQFTLCWNYILPQNGYLIYKDETDNTKFIEIRTDRLSADKNTHDFTRLITLLEQNDGILIENNLANSGVLFPFYDPAEYDPKSLLAFKTIVDAKQSLFWFYDAEASNFFNIQDKSLLQQVNSNTSYALNETILNQGLRDNSNENKSLSDLAHLLNQATDIDSCIDIFTNFLIQQFEASKFTIALREPDSENARIYKSLGIDDTYKQGAKFSLNEGLHGWVILKNKPYLIDNIDKGEYFVPRFSRTEKTNYQLRSFLSVPMQNEEEAFGMISLEDKVENKYSENDKARLTSYSNILASAFKRFNGNKIEIGE